MFRKSDNQTSFFGSFIYEHIIPQNHFLRKLSQMVDFSFVNDQCKHLYKENGRPCIEPQRLFKRLLLQYFHNLSDAQIEQEVNDRLSFKWFLGLDVNQPSPDAASLVYFRDRLGEKMFAELFNHIVHLARKYNLVSDQLHIVDATAVRAKVDLFRLRNHASSKNKKDSQDPPLPSTPPPSSHEFISQYSLDPQARFGHTSPTKKVLGYKAYIQMDESSEIIVSATADSANQQEANHLPELLSQIPKSYTPTILLADKAYDTFPNQAHLQELGIASGILLKRLPRKNPLQPPRFAGGRFQSNSEFRALAKRRCRIEHKIAEIKRWHSLRVARFWGLAKTKIQTLLSCTVVNLKRMVKLLTYSLLHLLPSLNIVFPLNKGQK